jgi:hypothetical protein
MTSSAETVARIRVDFQSGSISTEQSAVPDKSLFTRLPRNGKSAGFASLQGALVREGISGVPIHKAVRESRMRVYPIDLLSASFLFARE